VGANQSRTQLIPEIYKFLCQLGMLLLKGRDIGTPLVQGAYDDPTAKLKRPYGFIR
jgi:hypothetical protein